MTFSDTPMDSYRLPNSVSEDELHPLLDGRLSPRELAALETRLENDAVATATLAAWRTQRDALRNLHQPMLNEPLSPTLLAAAQQAARSQQQFDQWWRWGGLAASVALAFGVGWLSHGQWTSLQPDTAQVSARAHVLAQARDKDQEFAREAAVAHAVYAPEVRHPVEVTAEQQDHLVQWLSKRLDTPLKMPNLSAHGYELVGGRLLPGDVGARAQFMFQNAAGDRVTLYLGAINSKTTAEARREIPLTFSNEGPVPGFYWVDHGLGYALAGQLPRESLMQIAQAVCDQT